MFRVMTLEKRKSGISLTDFIDYHERQHVPLCLRYLGMAVQCRRRYLHPMPYPLDGRVAEPDYDVLTEYRFADQQRYVQGMAELRSLAANRALGEGGDLFLDRGSSRQALVTECASALPAREGNSDPGLTCGALLRRRADLSPQDFRDYYETRHARLGERHITALSGYRRLYLHPAEGAADLAYDVFTELQLADETALARAGEQFSDPAVKQAIAEDEAHFVDPANRCLAMIEERATMLAGE